MPLAALPPAVVPLTADDGSAWNVGSAAAPLLIMTKPAVPGAAPATADVPAPIKTECAVSDAAPVPPLATPSVPPSVSVPVPVIGPPENVRPVVPPDAATLVTLPTTCHAAPFQNTGAARVVS